MNIINHKSIYLCCTLTVHELFITSKMFFIPFAHTRLQIFTGAVQF